MSTTLRHYEASGFLLTLEEQLNFGGASKQYYVKIKSANHLTLFRSESFDTKAKAMECFDHFMSLINQLVFEEFEQEFH